MRSVTGIILHVFVALAIAEEDMVVNKLLSKLVDKLIDRATESLVDNEDLDDTTLGKTQPGMTHNARMITRGQPPLPLAVSAVQDKLRSYGISPSPLETVALNAIDANNQGTGMRNVIAMASSMPELSDLKKEVVVRVEAINNRNKMAGLTAPMGFFDPFGFSTYVDDEKLVFYREAELKHGRYGMLASLGIFAGEKFSPLFGWQDTTTPAAKLFLQGSPVVPVDKFWGAVIVAIGFAELIAQNVWVQGTGDRVPGDVGWDPLGLKPKTAEGLREMQNKELNNGRLAMLATAGMIAQEMVTGQKIF
jgi:hypothetical protein